MNPISLERGGSADQFPVHFEENDPDFVEFFRVLSTAMIRHCTKDQDVTDQESDIMYGRLRSMIDHIKNHKKAKRLIPASKKRRYIVMMEGEIDFKKLVESKVLPPPVFPWKERTYEEPTVKNNEQREEGGRVEGHAEASADAGAEADTKPLWPSVISETWQLYCTCGTCKIPSYRVRLRIGMVLEAGTFLLPVKVYASTDGWYGGLEGIIVGATLTNQHHETVANGNTLSVFSPGKMIDPSYKFSLVPHRLGLCVPDEARRILYQDHNRDSSWPVPLTQMYSEPRLAKVWPKENERWTVNEYMATQNHNFRGIRLEKREKIGCFRGLVGVAAFLYQTRN